ncbi:DUF5655 domain-containing protein [Lewinella sp. LCG006]|uniref:DUF5655 domain-containing protein n=1 Tax=Lewinella sp. LCG006 TaxID=3231911 RepID=UPI00345FA415
MYKVEYLIIVEDINCKTVKALKNLIQSDSDFVINRDQIVFNGFQFNYGVAKGNVSTGKKPVYFHLRLWIESESEMPLFTAALKRLRKVLSMVNRIQYTIWDDISRYYSEQAYGRINSIENLMRKLLTKFMLVNLGMGWDSDRIPVDVEKSINSNNKDVNILNNVDFIQLRNFLFSENYPSHRDDLVKRLRTAKNLDNTDIEEIRSLLPISNWTKYFETIVDCDGDFLDKRWKKLYDLRNKIAHNKSFSKIDLEEVNQLIDDIQEFIESAIHKLEEVVVPEEDIENVAEAVAGENNHLIGRFIILWKELEDVIRQVYYQQNEGDVERGFMPQMIKEFLEDGLISSFQFNQLRELRRVRNSLVHSVGIEYPVGHLENAIEGVSDYIELFRGLVRTEEIDHIDKIRNKAIVKIYTAIKDYILSREDVSLKVNKHYISFIGTGNILDVKLQQSSLKIWLNLNAGELEDPRGIAKDVSTIGHLGNGDYEITLKSIDDLEYLASLIDQAYEKDRLK